MYQAIPQNISEILLKRVIALICFLLVVMAAITFYNFNNAPTTVTQESINTSIDINKAGIIFSSF